MNIYLTILFGWIIGQIAFTVIAAYLLQLSKPNVDFIQSVRLYIKAEQGKYALAICALMIALFVLQDFVDPNIDKKGIIAKMLKRDVLTWPEKIVINLRSYSIGFGIFCSFILLVVFRKGIKAISDYNKNNALQDDTKPNEI